MNIDQSKIRLRAGKSALFVIFAICMLVVFSAQVETLSQGRAGTTLTSFKTIDGNWTRTIEWAIDKTVDQEVLNLENGESADVIYTITVDKTVTVESFVFGEICVTNGGERPTEGLQILDELTLPPSKEVVASTQIDVSDKPVLDPGESYCYEYQIDLDPSVYAGDTIKNTAHITITNHSGRLGEDFGPSPSDTTEFPLEPTVEGFEEVTVLDIDLGVSFFASDDSAAAYVVTYQCPEDGGSQSGEGRDHTNTAMIMETGQTASATVTVFCSGGEGGPAGCTPGYWKNHPEDWQGFSTGQTVQSVFSAAAGISSFISDSSLLEALSFQGGETIEGAAEILLRAAVAAILNAASADVEYPLALDDIIGDVNEALASGDRDTIITLAAYLDANNNLGCPL